MTPCCQGDRLYVGTSRAYFENMKRKLRKPQFDGDVEHNVECLLCHKLHATATARQTQKYGVCWSFNSSCLDMMNENMANRFFRVLNHKDNPLK